MHFIELKCILLRKNDRLVFDDENGCVETLVVLSCTFQINQTVCLKKKNFYFQVPVAIVFYMCNFHKDTSVITGNFFMFLKRN